MTADSVRAIERMLYPYKTGDRVRARLDIFCAMQNVTVPLGTLGTVLDPKATGCVGVLLVAWETGSTFHCTAEGMELLPS